MISFNFYSFVLKITKFLKNYRWVSKYQFKTHLLLFTAISFDFQAVLSKNIY